MYGQTDRTRCLLERAQQAHAVAENVTLDDMADVVRAMLGIFEIDSRAWRRHLDYVLIDSSPPAETSRRPTANLTSHAGSLLRPENLIALNERRAAGDFTDEAEYLSRLRTAVADVVARQRETGIDFVNGGHTRRGKIIARRRNLKKGDAGPNPDRGRVSVPW